MSDRPGEVLGEFPLSREEARRAADTVLDLPGAEGVELVFTASRVGMTRFANSEIIQNTLKHELRAYVRVVVGKRSASATTTQLDPVYLQRAATSALEAAQASPADPDFPGLPSPDEVGRAEALFRWDEPTSIATPSQRAEKVRVLLAAAGSDNAAGIYETSSHAFAVISSAGVDCFDAHTRAVTTCLVDSGEATGWGDESSHSLAEVDVEAAARRARAKVQHGPSQDAEPGNYEVVLEPAAVATIIEYLAYCGFGAKQVIEGESFLVGKQGSRVAAPEITVGDDVWHPRSVGIGFDFEGVPKRRVPVIDGGVATGPVTDVRTSRQLDLEVSGHYSGSSEFGPYAANVVLEAGEHGLDDLVAGVDAGILVTRFHYVNVLDRPTTLLTGMTRDGTFRIRGGEVAEPVHNFRFTQNALGALEAVRGVGRDLAAVAPDYGSFGSTVAPALGVGEFHFSSTTSH
ncbi:MAG: TldD/PmbA family protein [Actinomycetota bacterium]